MDNEIPAGAFLQSISPHYNQNTVQHPLKVFRTLEPYVWGRVVVQEGELLLHLRGCDKPLPVTPAAPRVIPAGTPFKVGIAPGQPVRFHIEYYHEARLTDEEELADLLGKNAASRRGTRHSVDA